MKHQIIKLVVLIALLTGSFSVSAQNRNKVSSFVIDKNIISFEIANLVDKVVCEHPPRTGYGSPEGLSPHFWTIILIMAEETDVTKLAPVITLAPSATITNVESINGNVHDFSQQVDYTIIAPDGSTVKYKFSAYTQEKTRANYSVTIQYDPISGGGYTIPPAGVRPYDNAVPFDCMAYPYPTYGFDHWKTSTYLSYYTNPFNDFFQSNVTLTAVFYSATQYTVTVQSEDTNKGTVSGGGSVGAGGSIPVSASPKSGYIFEGWYLNGSKISSSASFNYQPSASCSLTAKFTSVPIISGPNVICPGSSGTFTVNNAPQGYTWGHSSNLTPVPGNPGKFTASSVSGNGWVSINSGGMELAVQNIRIGAPTVKLLGPTSTVVNAYHQYTASLTGGTTVAWSATPGCYSLLSNSGTAAEIAFTTAGSHWIKVESSNACGSCSYYHYVTVNPCVLPPNCPTCPCETVIRSMVYPNPVSDILNIEISDEAVAAIKAQAAMQNRTITPDFDIRLYDELGNIQRKATAKGGKVEFNVSNLPNGNYYLHIHDGVNEKPEMQQIVVKH